MQDHKMHKVTHMQHTNAFRHAFQSIKVALPRENPSLAANRAPTRVLARKMTLTVTTVDTALYNERRMMRMSR